MSSQVENIQVNLQKTSIVAVERVSSNALFLRTNKASLMTVCWIC